MQAAEQEQTRIVMLPGIDGSGPAHWQTLWERIDPDIVRISPPSWSEPDAAGWSDAVDEAAGSARVLLIAHSLGALAATAWARRNPDRTAGVFLVAAPDPSGDVFPERAAAFREVAHDVPIGVPGLLVASDTDPYCSVPRAAVFADAWGTGLVRLGDLGHINADSGIGDWAEGRRLVAAFASGVGVPRHGHRLLTPCS